MPLMARAKVPVRKTACGVLIVSQLIRCDDGLGAVPPAGEYPAGVAVPAGKWGVRKKAAGKRSSGGGA